MRRQERGSVCVYRRVRSQTTEGVRDVGGRQCNCAGGCGAGDCAAVGYGVAAYDVSDDGDEALGVEIAGLKEMRQRDATLVAEALAGAGVRSGSPGVVEG